MRNARRGFTLIELLVVLAIISILSSIILVNVQRVRERGNDSVRLANLNAIRVALRLYAADNGHYPITQCASGWTWIGYGGLWGTHEACDSVNGATQTGWTLQTILAPYISQPIKDPTSSMPPSGSNPDAGYLYIGNGTIYCLMAFKVPENMLDFPKETWNSVRCSSVNSAGQCTGANTIKSIYYAVGSWANGC